MHMLLDWFRAGTGPAPAQSGTSSLLSYAGRIQEQARVRVNDSFILVEKQGVQDVRPLVASLTGPLRKKGKYTSELPVVSQFMGFCVSKSGLFLKLVAPDSASTF